MVSIVIPTLGRASLLPLLRSIGRFASLGNLVIDRDFEIVVCVDQRGHQKLGYDELGEDFRRVRLVPSDGVGVNQARNTGARASHGEILWFLDDDTEVCNESSLTALPGIFAEPTVLAAGGEYLSKSSAALSERGYNVLCSLWRASAGTFNAEQLLGGTLAVRKAAWQAVGGFDAGIQYGGAETLFVVRLKTVVRGNVRFDDVLSVVHAPSGRGALRWARIAAVQGRRKRETASALPEFSKRTLRAVEYLKKQEVQSLFSLACFALPFLTVSKCASIFRR